MVTIHDVARAAGVSISTVSYAISGKRTISATTRTRIDRAIAELHYEPNAGARMLAGSKTQILALSAPMRLDAHLPTHMRFVSAITDAARAHDYDVLLLAGGDETSGLRRVTARALTDGAIMLGVADDDERVPLVREAALPAAFIGVPEDSAGITCVDLDFEAAARDSVRHLIAQGHERIGVIGHPATYRDRHTGFIRRYHDEFNRAAQEAGARVEQRYPALGRENAKAAIAEVLAAMPDVSALVFHCNEPVVATILRDLHERGIRIPDDLSVLAACASYDAGDLEVPLTDIPLPLESMCRLAVAEATAQIEGHGPGGTTLIPPRLIERGSTRSV